MTARNGRAAKKDDLGKLGEQLITIQSRCGLLSRKRLMVAKQGGEVLRKMKQAVKAMGENWLDWLATRQARHYIRVSERTIQNWMRVAKEWPAIEKLMDANPKLIDLGEELALKLLRHRERAKNLTPDEAEELIAAQPKATPDYRHHDASQLLPLSDYRIECCTIAELGERLGLAPGCLKLGLADAPWNEEALPLYQDIGQFARTYLEPGHLLLCYAGALNLDDNIERLKAEGLTYVTEFSIQFPAMHSQAKLNGLKLRNGHRPILVFSNGPYQPEFWVDDSLDGLGRQKDADPMQANVEELMYWINRLTLPTGVRSRNAPADLVASLCGGVFSEAVACRHLARRFVGCDPDKRKCKRGLERLRQVTGVYTGTLYTRWRG